MSSQPGKQDDLDGSAPDNHITALLLVDVINDFEFPGGDQLLARALKIAPCLKHLAQRARAAHVPVIYANDNFGRWQSNFEQLLERCKSPQRQSRSFVEQVAPERNDYIILKPKNSAFYQTPLDILLKHLGTKRLVIGGLCTNSCVLFTAQDAYMRDLDLFVPCDCVASQCEEDHQNALLQMKTVTKANISSSSSLAFNPPKTCGQDKEKE
jgi:nicotinamidase-related amidase